MKITDVKVHLVRTRRNTQIPSPWILVQVFTDEGLVGLGDATNWPGGSIICKAIEELKGSIELPRRCRRRSGSARLDPDQFVISGYQVQIYNPRSRKIDYVGRAGVAGQVSFIVRPGDQEMVGGGQIPNRNQLLQLSEREDSGAGLLSQSKP